LSVVFLFASGQSGRLRRLLGELSEGFAMTGKTELWRARSSSSGVGAGAVAGVVLCDVGCPQELTSPVSSPVSASLSKSGASSLAAVASKAVIGPSDEPW
jgi:hypothetical protein